MKKVSNKNQENETFGLVKLSRCGNKKATEKIVRDNMGLVYLQSRTYAYQNQEIENDAILEGMIGLLDAIETWDPIRGSWSNCCMVRIRNRISYFLKNIRVIHAPINLYQCKNNLEKSSQVLIKKLKREPTDVELSKHSKVTLRQIKSTRQGLGITHSIDETYKDFRTADSLISYKDILVSENKTDEPLKNNRLRLLLIKSLETSIHNIKHRNMMFDRLGFETDEKTTYNDLADKYKMSREGVRKIEHKCLIMLKKNKLLKEEYYL
jgi:RNA polymerase sigma factor (sigma-70 family)